MPATTPECSSLFIFLAESNRAIGEPAQPGKCGDISLLFAHTCLFDKNESRKDCMDTVLPSFAGSSPEAQTTVEQLRRRIKALRRELCNHAYDLSRLLPYFYRPTAIPEFDGSAEKPVDLVLTVKNSYDVLAPCLESVFANTDVPFRLFLNDNCSDDPRTPALLTKARDSHPEQVFLFLQERDLGFMGAANMLLSKTANDTILLNSDTVMPPKWASRLLWPIRRSGRKIAATCPFSNSAAMIAFPDLRRDNDLFEGMRMEDLDRVFQWAKPTVEFTYPCGPGFCMAFSRAALDEIGYLDAEAFPEGYGSEVDWCCRALKSGYENVLTVNLFVYHKHGATMAVEPSQNRQHLMDAGVSRVRELYPWLADEIADFMDAPKMEALRSMLLLFASSFASEKVRADFIAGVPESAPADGPADTLTLVAGCDPETGRCRVAYRFRRYRGSFTAPSLNWAIKLLYRIKLTEITVDKNWSGDATCFPHSLTRLARNKSASLMWKN